MITRIYVDNYRCFTNFTFEPKQVNLLVGDNGSGKSYLLNLLYNLRVLALSSDGLKLFRRTGRTRWDKRTSQRFELVMESAERASFEWVVVIEWDLATNLSFIEKETIRKDGTLIAEFDGRAKKLSIRGKEVPVPYQLDGSLLALRIVDADLSELHRLIDELFVLKLDLSAMEATSSSPAFLRIDGTNFPSSYRYTREKSFEETKQFHESLQTVIPGFRTLEFEDEGDKKKLEVRLFAGSDPQKSKYTVAFEELSDGQRALIVLYHAISSYALTNRTLLIDEPDNYIALRELQPWLQALSRNVEETNGQSFIVSHNPEVIDYLAADTAWLFERNDGGPVRVRPLPIDRSSGLKASEQIALGWVHGA